MNLCSLGLLITVLLGLPDCENQPAPPPKGVDNTAASAPAPSPSRSPVEPSARAEISMSPPLQKTPGNGTAAPTLSTPAGSSLAPSESATPSDATLPAGGRPVFKNQAANNYLESYDAYITDFKEAYRQMRQGEMAKYKAVIARVADIQSKGEQIRGELSPEEQQEFTEYLARKAQELGQPDRNQ